MLSRDNFLPSVRVDQRYSLMKHLFVCQKWHLFSRVELVDILKVYFLVGVGSFLSGRFFVRLLIEMIYSGRIEFFS